MRFEKAKPRLKNDESTFVSGVFDVIGDSAGIKKTDVAFVQDTGSLLVQFKGGTRELHPERFPFLARAGIHSLDAAHKKLPGDTS